MKYCNKCGNKLNDGVKFCTECGTEYLSNSKVQLEEQLSNSESIPRENLNAYNDNGINYTEENRVNKNIIIVCVTIIVITFAILGFVIVTSNNTEKNNITSSKDVDDNESEEISTDEKNEDTDKNNVVNETPANEDLEEDVVEETQESNDSDLSEIQDENDLYGDYILPYSSETYIYDYELLDLTDEELKIARNEIFARNGRKFKSPELTEYFNSKSWYNGYIEPSEFSESYLNEYEKFNIEEIKAVENSRKQ